MPVPDLVLDLVKKIAEHFLKSWWQETQELSTSSGVAKHILGTPAGSRTYREATRQFGGHADRLAEDLQPIVDEAPKSIDEGEKESVLIAVAEAFGAAQLTPQLLVSRDLDQHKVAECVFAA